MQRHIETIQAFGLPFVVAVNRFLTDTEQEVNTLLSWCQARPSGFTITIREFRPSSGAGFLVALTGAIMTMPGLPKKPSALNMDVDENGQTIGIF